MKRFNLFNNVFGWLSFLIAAITYLLTIEPTASFWDCSEFILSSYKMEVGHPPGAPFFMLTAKFFTLFTSDVTEVARMVNSMSAIMSALTILFLFWSITHLARKLIYTDSTKEMSLGEMIVIIGSGLVGALAYTFSDTFWFSAVEAEVYAYSSMFTALVFWLILKWEHRAHEPGSDKWLVLIAYVMGLSIGVHLLNLLCIPAIVLVYYFKKKENANMKGTLWALLISFALIVVLMYGIIPGFSKVGGWFELFFVNSMGFSYNMGVLFYFVLVIGAILWGLYESFTEKGDIKRAKVAFVLSMALAGVTFIGSSIVLWLILNAALVGFVFWTKDISFRMINTSLLCLMVILVGYSSFALIPIRSMANTPMDQNSPEHVFSLAGYLNREQYGDRPLIYGQTYTSKDARDEDGRMLPAIRVDKTYDKIVKTSEDQKDQYVVASTRPIYEQTNQMLLPRMHSSREQRHLLGYQMWGGVDLERNQRGEFKHNPTMMENIRFFFSYQLDYMYFRYFMWNFSGRQNDIQGDGGISRGNWITGIGFIDEAMGKGPQYNLPPDIADNKGHNKYFALPLLLGILGILFHISKKKEGEKQFLVTFMLFFMTGIAIILYLNQQPFEPRERDYAYAGSFYAFSIWIGLGVAFLWNLLKKVLPETPAAAIVTVIALLIPIQMASENWDDHDRSNRYTMRDFAINYLDTVEPNGILFTMGDNDTFPLWYMQEVEGYRTDVRVCNLSYLQTDWYVDQMRRQSYDSEPVPINWERGSYVGDRGQAAHVYSRSDMEQITRNEILSKSPDKARWMNYINYNEYFDTAVFKNEMELETALEILKTKETYIPRNNFVNSDGVLIPASKFTTKIDMENVNWGSLNAKPDSTFSISLGDHAGGIYRQEIMIMEMLHNINEGNWERPIYYAVTIGKPPLDLEERGVFEGVNLRILPGKLDSTGVNVDKMYDNMMNKYRWGGVDNPNVYLDENNLRMTRSFRLMFARLVEALMWKRDYDRALKALDRCIEVLPGNTIPRGGESIGFARAYYRLGEKAKAQALMTEMMDRTNKSLAWYASMDSRDMRLSGSDIRELMEMKTGLMDVYMHHDREIYMEMLSPMVSETGVFLSNGVMFETEIHPLVRVISGYSQMKNSGVELSAEDEEVLNKVLNDVFNQMRNYAPSLLQLFMDDSDEE